MLTRRGFVACAFCAAGSFVASGAGAQAPSFRRILLKRADGPVEGYETLEMRIEFDPGVVVARVNMSQKFTKELMDALNDSWSKYSTMKGIKDLPETPEQT